MMFQRAAVEIALQTVVRINLGLVRIHMQGRALVQTGNKRGAGYLGSGAFRLSIPPKALD